MSADLGMWNCRTDLTPVMSSPRAATSVASRTEHFPALNASSALSRCRCCCSACSTPTGIPRILRSDASLRMELMLLQKTIVCPSVVARNA